MKAVLTEATLLLLLAWSGSLIEYCLQQNAPSEQVVLAHVSPDSARELMKVGPISLIDVRPSSEYERGHIRGAFNLPRSAFLQGSWRVISPTARVFLYGGRSDVELLGRLLYASGYRRVFVIEGGWEALNS